MYKPNRISQLVFLCIYFVSWPAFSEQSYSPYAGSDTPTNLYWGDTHLHTNMSSDAYGPDCMQTSTMGVTSYPEDNFFYHPPVLSSEDCLYLNVWTAHKEDAQVSDKLPVMVWIHGGGFEQGAGSWPLYDGTELASKGVVVVTFNYRLGIFGYFAHPALTKESPHSVSGNYGTTDQILALKWVQNYIEDFGGDPNSITIFGESAGGGSVLQLMTSPLAKGLFHRAIAQSADIFTTLPELTVSRLGKPSAESVGLKFSSDINRKLLQNLREMPAAELLKAARENNWGAYTNRTVDGWVLTSQIYDIFYRGKQHDVPVITGFNSNESYSLFMGSRVSRETYIENIKKEFCNLADEYLSFYPSDDWKRSDIRAWQDSWAVLSMEGVARMMGQVSSKAYLYYFNHISQGSEGAFHTAEISYVFNNEKNSVRYSKNMPSNPPRKSDLELADKISDYWVTFSKTGVPALESLVEWIPYKDEARHYMKFENGGVHPSKNLLPDVWEFQYKLNSRKRKGMLCDPQ